MISLLVLVLKVTLLHLSVEQVVGSSITHNEVALQDQQSGILSKPSAYIIGPDRTTLVVCRISSILDRSVGILSLHCKGVRRKAHLQHFSTTNDDIPSVTTARLIVSLKVVKKNKHHIICYCIDVTTKEKSHGLVISMKPAPGNNSILSDSNHFKPRRNGIRTIALGSSMKLSWRFPNSSEVHCLHDGHSLTVDQVVTGEGKISVVINEALRKDAGFYYCRSKSGAFSSWFKLQVKEGWSKWQPWLACSSQCGPGKIIETRRCLETRLERCQGPSVRALPCVGRSCKGIVPQFVNEPVDQVIVNGSSTYVTCAAGYNSNLFTVQMVCTSKDWKIKYFPIQNKTSTAGSSLNYTVARITYEVELHRDKSDLAMVYCHCYASTNQMTTRSRTAKISFPSEWVYNASGAKLSNDSLSFTTTGSRVNTSSQDTKGHSKTLNTLITAALGISVAVLILVVWFVFGKWRKKQPCRTSRQTKEALPSREENPHDIESYETGTVRYVEPPDTKIITLHSSVSSEEEDTLENRASNNPLLKCYLEVSAEPPVLDYTSRPSKVMTEETDCDNQSVFQRGESWKSNKSKISAFSSVSAGLCPKPKLPETVDPEFCAWGQFTEKGGRLTIEGTDVTLYIPSNAIPEGTIQVIYIGLMNSKGTDPKVNDQEALLSPVVVCGPDGLTFEKPVFLTVPHNAVLDGNNCWNSIVQSCSTVGQEEEENKWKVLETPGGDAPLIYIGEKHMQFMVEHFTNFAVVGVPDCTNEASAQLDKLILAYYTEPKVSEDCMTRVYCIPAREDAYEKVEREEAKVNGKKSDTPKELKISKSNKDLQITSKKTHEGWSAVTENQKSIPFDVIWQQTKQDNENGTQQLPNSPNVSFMFERVSPEVSKFRTTFDARQEESDTGVEALVSFCIEGNRRASSGYDSQAHGCETGAKYKIPIDTRRELCYLLDPDDSLCNDYGRFAEELGLSKNYINYLKRYTRMRSPTNELIELWEMTLSEQKPLSHILDIFRRMERFDVVEELQKIPGLESASKNKSC